MINYSIWKFIKFQDLTDFMTMVKDFKPEIRKSAKQYGDLELKSEFRKLDGLEEIEIQQVRFGGYEIKYLAFTANVQTCALNNETEIYEVKDDEKKIVAFEKNNCVQVVILSSLKNAKRVINKIFGNQLIWGIIEEENYITEDMLYWFFYKIREVSNKPIMTNPDIYLEGIYSYLGRTNDKINAVRGVGKRVTALLGTLGMILGEESLRALRPIIQYESQMVNIELYIGNTGKIYDTTYDGDWINQEKLTSQMELVLLVCKYILPNIRRGYENDCIKEEWSIKIKQIFLRQIGNEMGEKVEIEMEKIEKELYKLEEENLEQSEDEEVEIENSEFEIDD